MHPTRILLLLTSLSCTGPALAVDPNVQREIQEGVQEVMREREEARRAILDADSPEEALRAAREGHREILRERQEARQEVRKETRRH